MRSATRLSDDQQAPAAASVVRPCALKPRVGAWMSSAASAVLDLIYPPHCGACESPLDPDDGGLVPGLCAACAAQIALLERDVCARCASPLGPFSVNDTDSSSSVRCPRCKTLALAFRRTWAACRYTGPLQNLVRRYKYGRRPAVRVPLQFLLKRRLGPVFGVSPAPDPISLADDVLAESDAAPFYGRAPRPEESTVQTKAPRLPDVIIPVPLHRARERQRGFNQARLLAEDLARLCQLPLDARSLVRVLPTEEQAGKSRAERLRALAGAFALRRPAKLAGKTVLLVDDVMTTGSTAHACARVLRGLDAPQGTPTVGAREVWVAVVARA